MQCGVSLPAWHCPFLTRDVGGRWKPCQAASDACQGRKPAGAYERDLWAHVRVAHGSTLRAIARKWMLLDEASDDAEELLTLFNTALAEKERRSVPQLGHSTDRRVMQHVSEVFRDGTVHVLMCFMCACKEVAHYGHDKFGNGMQKRAHLLSALR